MYAVMPLCVKGVHPIVDRMHAPRDNRFTLLGMLQSHKKAMAAIKAAHQEVEKATRERNKAKEQLSKAQVRLARAKEQLRNSQELLES